MRPLIRFILPKVNKKSFEAVLRPLGGK